MSKIRALIYLSLVITIVVICWLLTSQILTCALAFLGSMFLFSIFFGFPQSDFLLLKELEQRSHKTGKPKVTAQKVSIKSLTENTPNINSFVKSQTRIADSENLISYTRKAAYIASIAYIFLLLLSIFTSKIVEGASEDLQRYKDVSGMIYTALGVIYIVYYLSPVNAQRHKNESTLGINHSEDH